VKKLINQVESVLEEQLQGLAEAHPELLVHADPVFVTRADAPVAGKVAILSGGGSGYSVALAACVPANTVAKTMPIKLNARFIIIPIFFMTVRPQG